MTTRDPNSSNKDQERAEERISQDRRKALARLGKLAVYTPPTITTLVITETASAWSQPLPPPPPFLPPPPP